MELAGTVYHPGYGQPMRYQAHELASDPDTQVAQTIEIMRRLALEDAADPVIRGQAQAIASEFPGREVDGVFWQVKKALRFVRDEVTAAPVPLDGEAIEVVVRPRDLARMSRPQEDCDGFSGYAMALLRALGIPGAFVTLAGDPRAPGRYSHVYVAAYPAGERVALDASHGAAPGWEAPNLFGKIREWPLEGDSAWLAGLAMIAAAAWVLWSGR